MRKALVLSLVFAGISLHVGAQDIQPPPSESAQTSDMPPLKEESIDAPNSLEALSLVQAYMGAIKSMKADFVQEAPNGSLTGGTLYMARPGKIRFDFNGDVPFLVVADGKTLNFVDYEIGQVTRWPVKDTPMLALLGDGLDLGAVNARIDAAPLGRTGQLALTASHPDQPEMGQITLFFDRTPDAETPLRLTQWIVRDGQGGLTSVHISGEETNVQLAESLWAFDDPRGLAKRRRTRR
jgi:outer membrane lipoprotein-sorting protein